MFGTLQRGSGMRKQSPADERPAQSFRYRAVSSEAQVEQAEMLDQESLVAPRAGFHRAGVAAVGEFPIPVLAAVCLRAKTTDTSMSRPGRGSPANQQISHASSAARRGDLGAAGGRERLLAMNARAAPAPAVARSSGPRSRSNGERMSLMVARAPDLARLSSNTKRRMSSGVGTMQLSVLPNS